MDDMEEMMQQIMKMLVEMKASDDAYQEKMAADRKADKEERKAYQEKMAADCEDFLAKMKEEIREANQDLLTEMKEDLLTKMKEVRKADIEDFLATKKSEQDTEMMQSAEEHQDIPTENVAVMPVVKTRKWRRVRKSNAGRRGEPKELNRGNHGSQKKLAAACRKVSRYATVAWRKRKLFRKSETRRYLGLRKGVTVANRRTSGHATVE
jgi:hypothetical protein